RQLLMIENLDRQGVRKGRPSGSVIGQAEKIHDDPALDLLGYSRAEEKLSRLEPARALLSSCTRKSVCNCIEPELGRRHDNVQGRAPEIVPESAGMRFPSTRKRESFVDEGRHARTSLAEIGPDRIF